MMWNDTVSLYIDDTSVRLLVSRGNRIKKWSELHLETGLVKGSVVVDEETLASRIKELLKSQNVHTKKVSLCFSGLHSLTRPATLPHLPKAMLSEAVAREARRVLPVPLDQLYLAWHTVPCPKGRIQVFIAATPRRTADSLISTLHKAGLVPGRMAIKPLALTKLVPVNSAIIIDVQPHEFDILILSDGIAQPIRTVSFPEETQTLEKKLEMIASDLDRTIKFYNTNNPEKPLNASIQVYVSGELAGQSEIQKSLSTVLQRPVIELTSSLKIPPQISLARYLINIALIVNSPNSVRLPTFPIANLNVLPAPYLPKPISFTKVAGIPAGVALLGLIVPIVMTIQNTNANIANMQNQLDITNQMIKQKTAQKNELTKTVTTLKSQSDTLKKTCNELKLALGQVTSSQEKVNGDLNITLQKLSTSITLEKITESEGTLTLEGTAPNSNDVFTYAQAILAFARQLDVSKRYKQSTVTSLKIPPSDKPYEGTFIEFKLTFQRED
jgi:type IV pilus assembly protein PilM